MKYAIVEGCVVVNLARADGPLHDNWVAFDGAVNIGDLWDGQSFRPAPATGKDPAQVQAEIEAEVQKRLDDFAGTRYYNSILSACTYATSTVPRFAAEGQYCVAVRDTTWAKCYEILTEVQAGTRPMPTGYADIEAELPPLAWPTESQ